jgi:hypothetical protein
MMLLVKLDTIVFRFQNASMVIFQMSKETCSNFLKRQREDRKKNTSYSEKYNIWISVIRRFEWPALYVDRLSLSFGGLTDIVLLIIFSQDKQRV